MEKIAEFFVKEIDPWYQDGIEKGIDDKNRFFIKILLLETDFSIPRIALLSAVPKDFILKIKDELAIPMHPYLHETNWTDEKIADQTNLSTLFVQRIRAEFDLENLK